MSAFLSVIQAFNQANVSYVVVGGIATVLHGHSRLTADLDFVIELSKENVLTALSELERLGYQPRIPVRAVDFADPAVRGQWMNEKGLTVFSLFSEKNPLAGVDLFVDYPMDYALLKTNAVVKQLGEVLVRICSLDDLIALKRKAGRPKDLEDIRVLEIIRNHGETDEN